MPRIGSRRMVVNQHGSVNGRWAISPPIWGVGTRGSSVGLEGRRESVASASSEPGAAAQQLRSVEHYEELRAAMLRRHPAPPRMRAVSRRGASHCIRFEYRSSVANPHYSPLSGQSYGTSARLPRHSSIMASSNHLSFR